MTGTVVLILVGVVGAIILIGVLTQLAEGVSGEWKELAGRYPAQAPAHDAERGEARIRIGLDPDRFWVARGCLWIFMPWTWTRGLRQVRYAADDEYFHLETEGGRLAPRSAMSIPWGDVDVEEPRVATHMGEYAVLRVGEVAIAMPREAIGRELGIRQEMESEPGGDTTEGEDEFRLTEEL